MRKILLYFCKIILNETYMLKPVVSYLFNFFGIFTGFFYSSFYIMCFLSVKYAGFVIGKLSLKIFPHYFINLLVINSSLLSRMFVCANKQCFGSSRKFKRADGQAFGNFRIFKQMLRQAFGNLRMFKPVVGEGFGKLRIIKRADGQCFGRFLLNVLNLVTLSNKYLILNEAEFQEIAIIKFNKIQYVVSKK